MSFNLVKSSFLIAVLLLSFSCGKSTEDEIKDNIDSANILLSTRQCQSAIDLLEGMGRQNKNAHYLKALSSAYACRAGYSTTVFFGTDIEKTATPGPLGGITTYSTSTVASTSPLTDDLKFRDLQTAIDILLYAGGISATTEPTSIARASYFTASQAGDINAQLVYMMLVQAGKFMKVYADADASGVKGGGSAGNNCFTDYSNADDDVKDLVPLLPGACKVLNDPHPQLDSSLMTVTERRKRLCEGVVLFNGILDLLPSIILSAGGGDLDDIANVTGIIETAKDTLETVYPAVGTVLNVLSQTNCETDPAITTGTLEAYYVGVFETLIE